MLSWTDPVSSIDVMAPIIDSEDGAVDGQNKEKKTARDTELIVGSGPDHELHTGASSKDRTDIVET